MKKLTQFSGALPFFIAVFLNAFMDLGHKITIQNTVFKLYDGEYQITLIAILNAMILLPFILLLSPAGFISDKFRKARVMQFSAWVAVILCAGITVCYYQGWFWAAFLMTFLMAAQSAIYSPAKYGFIKEMFGKNRLGEANGVVAALSIIAILAGSFAFSTVFESWFVEGSTDKAQVMQAIAPIGWLLLATSVVELIMMYRLPEQEPTGVTDQFAWKKFATGKLFMEDLSPLAARKVIRLSVIGLATFWSVGQVMLAAFPEFLKSTLDVSDTRVVQGILACSGIGIAIGSAIAGKLSKDHIETGLLPIGACGLAIGLLLLPSSNSILFASLDFFFIGLMGGMFIVPLNALIQYCAGEHNLGKTLAANNWLQNVSMLSFLIITVLFAKLGWSSTALLYLIAGVALVGGCYTIYQLPQSLTRFLLSTILSRHYRVKVQGMKNIPSKGGVLLLGNHVSWIDWAILQIASPRPVRFVMIKYIYQRWYLKWFFDLFGCIPIEQGPGSRKALEQISELLNAGEVVCLFPEGVISRNGHLAEFRRGYEQACENVSDDVMIVPFYFRGLWGSQFSRSSAKLKKIKSTGLRRDLIVAFGTPISKDTKVDVLKRRVLDLSISSWQEYIDELPSIPHQWIETVKKQGKNQTLVDTLGTKVSAFEALVGARILARRIHKLSPEQNIGLLLPTSVGGMLGNMAGLLAGKTLVNLNYTASEDALLSALEQADIKSIYTSKRFIKKLSGKGVNVAPLEKNASFIYLEDLKESASLAEKILTLFAVRVLPLWLLKFLFASSRNPDASAAILFSSGSEGAPKGVMLSHKNIMANVKQIADVLNMEGDDVVMANLPLFHAFGLTATQFMPLLEGIPLVCHPDPTDALGSAKAMAQNNVTLMFGTSSFFRLYIRNTKVHPLMLQTLKTVVGGAEKLQEDVRKEFKLKFNKDILEGYGATETTPVASVNLPDKLGLQDWKIQRGEKPGSVGMPLPGTSCKIVDPDSFVELETGESGMILIGGGQVMLGYLKNPEKTAAAIREIDGIRWYVTGDKGFLDADGFLVIQDRYSRFAKIAGEMVGLGNVELAVTDVLNDPDLEVVAVNIQDEKKGEKIILLSNKDIDEKFLREQLATTKLNKLAYPASVIKIDEIPKLGSGKTDFSSAKRIASESGS